MGDAVPSGLPSAIALVLQLVATGASPSAAAMVLVDAVFPHGPAAAGG